MALAMLWSLGSDPVTCTQQHSITHYLLLLLLLPPPLPLLPAAAGLNGLVDAVEPGLACGSDTSHMNILGYDPRK
jgi:hypothetical protein